MPGQGVKGLIAQGSVPSMRASSPWERLADRARGVYEGVAEQPLGRIADALGLSNIRGMADSFSNPNLGMRRGEVPVGPGKGIKALKSSKPWQINASGESEASMEAINRARSMADRGEQFVVRKHGTERPLSGVEAHDYRVQPGEEFGLRDAQGNFSLRDRGVGASNAPLRQQAGAQVIDETPDLIDIGSLDDEMRAIWRKFGGR